MRRRRTRRWEDIERATRAAMRCDLEDSLQAKIENARRDLVRAVNTNAPRRVRQELARRVENLRALLGRAEKLRA